MIEDFELGRTDEPVRVILADDNSVVRCVLGERLRQNGHSVRLARNGQEALEAFSEEGAEVVVTDLNMPGIDGLGLLAALREHPEPPEVILLTGAREDDAQAAIQALRLGAHDYIAKNSSAAEAVTLAVARAAEKWRLRRDNARLLGELRRLSLEDGLTGVGNRRAMDGTLRQEIARSRRHHRGLALVILDLDHFKRVNDTLGHQAGDEVLTSFAVRARLVVRQEDGIFRYGGEEFAAVLVDTGLEEARALAERIVRATEATPFSALGERISVTCSAGVAALDGDDDELGCGLVLRADHALYCAKHEGRNRVCVDRTRTVERPTAQIAALTGR